MTDEAQLTAPDQAPAPRVRRRIVRRPKTGFGWFLLGIVLLVFAVAMAGLVTRYGVLTPQGRLLIEARTSGLKLGRIGKLKIEGLSGDIWREFGVKRLTISDEGGIWLDASDVSVAWRSGELFRRRFHATAITAAEVRVLRRPTLEPKGVSRDLPLSFDVDSLKARLEMLPAFSVRRGFFDLAADFEVERFGGAVGKVTAASLLHAGDGISATFDVGKTKEIKLIADAVETQGGALAGALGLPADKPFSLTARAQGTTASGRASLKALVGDLVPIEGSGSWNGQRGEGSARVMLSASSLTQSSARRFGPEARLDLSGVRNDKGLFDLDLRGRAENLTLRARGPVDLGKRSTTGLALEASVVDLNRLVSTPRMGAGRFVGRLSGQPSAWEARGDLTGTALSMAGYTLASAKGPATVSWRKKELTIKADLSGQGGSGTSLFSTWMGPTPRLSATVARIPGRGYLIRAIDGKGAGFDLQGQGSRGLLGHLNFSGDVRVSNLAAAKRGASGVLAGRWTASQAKSGDPWAVSLDGRGTDFKSSLEQLDRLLGSRPRVQARLDYLRGDWKVSSIEVDGDKADISGAGVLAADNSLKFALKWVADGPFRAGPVEVAGRATGTGALLGTLAQPRMDLDADVDAIDLPQLAIRPAHVTVSFGRADGGGTDGTIRLTGRTEYGDAAGRAAFRFAEGGVDLSGIDARAAGITAQGSLMLRSGSPSRADLTLTATPGAFLDAGRANARVRIVDAPGGAQGSIRLEAAGLRFKDSQVLVRSLNVTADGPMSRLPYTLTADVDMPQAPLKLEGRGIASENGQAYAVSFEGGGKIRGVDVRTLTPFAVNFGGPQATAAGALGIGGGRADIRASQGGDQVSIDARVDGVDLAVFNADLAGKITGVLAVGGRGSALTGSLDARLAGARSRDGPAELAIDGTIGAALSGSRLTVEASVANAQGLKSTASAVLPAEASAAPFRIAINRTRPISGRFDIDGELQPIWDLFFGGARTLGGRVIAQGEVSGTINDPTLVGRATLAAGRLEDAATGLKLSNVSMIADLNQDRVTVSQFSGADGRGGTVTGQGAVSLERGGSSTFTLKATRFLVIDNDLAEAQASGDVTVTRGADGKAKLVGRLVIDRADIVADPPTPSGVVTMAVIERNRPANLARATPSASVAGLEVALDVTLTAPRRIFVRGRGLDVELSLDAHVGGTTARPVLDGTARVVRGEYDFAGKRFDFDDDGVVYLASSADRIRLNLQATRSDPSLTAVVKILGTAAEPEITLTSNPVLPSDEVLSQVLFGRSASQLSPLEAAQLASAVASLATGGGFDVIGGLRSLAGLDRLAFAGGDASGVAVSGGKYLTDDVYLELTGGGREGGTAQVEWRVRRSLSIVSRLAGDGDTRLSVRWRRDYGKQATQTAPPAPSK